MPPEASEATAASGPGDVSPAVAEVIRRDRAVISPCTHIPFFPLVAASGKGARLYDIDGREYIDFLAAAGILNVGHNHPAVVEAIKRQADRMVHYNSAYVYHEPMVELAEVLCEITPGKFEKQVAFGLSGSDANDGVIKVARAYTGRQKVLSFHRSYHGNTFGALSLSAVNLNMRRGFGPAVPEIYHLPYPDTYRGPASAEECLAAIRELLTRLVPAEEVAAIVVEPVQGDSGILVPPVEFIRGLKALCEEIGALFVAEEVQTGFGRTGRWFAIEHFGVEPDIVVLGKAIAAGMPLSAIVGRREIMESWQSPGHVFSTGANPVSCAAALANIRVLREEGLIARSAQLGAYLKERLLELQRRHALIGDVRGLGLMLGVDLVVDRATKERAVAQTPLVVWRAFELGLFITFFSGSVLRVAPPLVITREEVDRAVQILDQALADVAAGRVPAEIAGKVRGW